VVDVFLIVYDASIYFDLFKHLFAPPVPIASRRFRLAAKVTSTSISVIGIVLSACAIGYSIVHFQKPVADFTGLPQVNGSGAWKIDSITIGGQPITLDPGASFFFNVFNTCIYGTVQNPSFGTFEADNSHHTFRIEKIVLGSSASTIQGTYEVQDKHLVLNGTRDNLPLSMILEQAYPHPRQ